MNVCLITVGRIRNKYIAEGLAEYLKRLKRYIPFEIMELPDVKNAGRISKDEQKESEGRLIISKLQPSDYVILLDERGKHYTSKEFALKLEGMLTSGKKRLVMIIGGPYGFSRQLYDRANELLSLSKMTFNHEMARLFITEQLYRAMTILRGEPYHHD